MFASLAMNVSVFGVLSDWLRRCSTQLGPLVWALSLFVVCWLQTVAQAQQMVAVSPTLWGARLGDSPCALAADSDSAVLPQAQSPIRAVNQKKHRNRVVRAGRPLGRGLASWYGPRFHGRKTANGEIFDMNRMTAAHRTLPFGTKVVVQSARTGRQVVVRINDRGPYARGRVIDLSKAAAAALGIQSRGRDAVVLREALMQE